MHPVIVSTPRQNHHPTKGSVVFRCLLGAVVFASIVASTSAQPNVDARPNERADPRDTIPRSAYHDRIDVVSIGLDYVASPGGGSFFPEYRKLGSFSSQLGTYVAPTLAGRIAFADDLRLIANLSYHSVKFTDSYAVFEDSTLTPPAIAGVAEDFQALAVPVLAGIEWAPIRTQFTSYVGVGAGFAVTKVKWQSTVQFTNGSYIRPQGNIDAMGVAPAVRAYAGMDLRFDRPSESKATFRGIFLEASYLFLPVSAEYFGELRSRGQGIDRGPASSDATLYLGGLSFTFGLNLQVLRQ
ncbi:MAG: hypothetical protein H7X80_04805 [bacterium]|nr:hypothetical protein [Candidatus Kapabacteria bacterium]